MSSFAINGRFVFDPAGGVTAFAHAASDEPDTIVETRSRGVTWEDDARLHLLELVASLALEIRGRGDDVTALDIE